MASSRRSAPSRTSPRRAATGRAARSAAGVRKYGLPLKPSWKSANYAYPGGVGASRGKRPSYPISPRYVKAALSRSAQSGTAGTGRHVRWALGQRYGSVPQALAAARRAGR
jgi:hypothetical protein